MCRASQRCRQAARLRAASSNSRRGAAVIEFAVLLPVLLVLIFGIIEFGRSIMVQQVITNASREGARRAILEGSDDEEVMELVQSYLASCSVNGATVDCEPEDLNSVGFGDPVTVSVSVPYSSVSWLPSSWFMSSSYSLNAATTMNGERPE